MRRLSISILAAVGLSTAAAADSVTLYDYDGSFDDAVFSLESAIIGRGLVIDYVSHVGAMLERTREDVGGSETLYANANVFLFCSAILSRKVMEADPLNIAHCPYGVFITEAAGPDGQVQIGYRAMPEGPMKEVEALLDDIAREATSF